MAINITEIEHREKYIWVRINPFNTREVKDINLWCQQTGCGKQVNPWTFAFKSDSEYTMFALRWC